MQHSVRTLFFPRDSRIGVAAFTSSSSVFCSWNFNRKTCLYSESWAVNSLGALPRRKPALGIDDIVLESVVGFNAKEEPVIFVFECRIRLSGGVETSSLAHSLPDGPS